MSFSNTEPVAIDRLDIGGTWRRFRVDDPRRRFATLREICHQDAPVTLGAVAGWAVTASLWAVDQRQNRLAFGLDPSEGGLTRLLTQPDLWAAAYLENAKVQFSLHRVMADRAGQRLCVHSDAPMDMYHLPRRRAVRLRRDGSPSPLARLSTSSQGLQPVALRVFDVSMSGCAVQWAVDDVPPPVGAVICGVELELDDQTFIFTDLRIQHVTRAPRNPGQWRVGCVWIGLPEAAHLSLQAWILRGRRRRELITLSLD
jgi:c-di-GMP-binding flagellar brake protein YcgR